MVTAAAQDQWRLLDVQAHDTRLAQIAHRQKAMPEHAEIAELQARLAAIDAEVVVARTRGVAVHLTCHASQAGAPWHYAVRSSRTL